MQFSIIVSKPLTLFHFLTSAFEKQTMLISINSNLLWVCVFSVMEKIFLNKLQGTNVFFLYINSEKFMVLGFKFRSMIYFFVNLFWSRVCVVIFSLMCLWEFSSTIEEINFFFPLDLIPLNLNQHVYIVLFLDSLLFFIDVFDNTYSNYIIVINETLL